MANHPEKPQPASPENMLGWTGKPSYTFRSWLPQRSQDHPLLHEKEPEVAYPSVEHLATFPHTEAELELWRDRAQRDRDEAVTLERTINSVVLSSYVGVSSATLVSVVAEVIEGTGDAKSGLAAVGTIIVGIALAICLLGFRRELSVHSRALGRLIDTYEWALRTGQRPSPNSKSDADHSVITTKQEACQSESQES